jgi:hypothetical protein
MKEREQAKDIIQRDYITKSDLPTLSMLSAGEFLYAIHCRQSKKVLLSLMGICCSVDKDKKDLSAFVVPRNFQFCFC